VDNVRIIADRDAVVAVVEQISDELKEHLRARLNEYCYGSTQSREDSDFYSFANTVRQLLERYDSKAKTTQLGMAGELLIHLVLPLSNFELTSGGIFFNKEEKHIKKGFDLTFLERHSPSVWYGEVKSGEISIDTQTADSKAHELLLEAARDLALKLKADSPRSRWESAIIDAGLALASEDATSMKTLLRRDSSVLETEGQFPANAVLAGVVFHDYIHCEVSGAALSATAQSIARSGKFTKLRVLAAQQAVFDGIIAFLRDELCADA